MKTNSLVVRVTGRRMVTWTSEEVVFFLSPNKVLILLSLKNKLGRQRETIKPVELLLTEDWQFNGKLVATHGMPVQWNNKRFELML